MEPILKPIYSAKISEQEMNENLDFTLGNFQKQESAPHKFFMYVIGALSEMKKTIFELDYTSPTSEEIFRDIQFYFASPNSINDEVYKDVTINYVKSKCSKKEFLSTIDELLASQYENKSDVQRISEYFKKSVDKNPKRIEFFLSKGLSTDDAHGCALALSYYTGAQNEGNMTSNDTNRRASAVLRFGLKDQKLHMHFQKIYYFLMKALSYIPYYWGKCIRAAELKDDETSRYDVGNVVSWIQFSSSASGASPPAHFAKRNTYFYIYSLTGRSIKQFSNFSDEDEVLFSPYSTFLVCKKFFSGGKNHIYLRQIDVGMNQNVILWVDDQILKKDWENKMLMEKFSSEEGFEKNLHIIPKVSTNAAISFLESSIGKYFKQNMNFQVISDMTRPDEENGNEAGAIFTKKIRDLGFKQKVMIYTSNKQGALDKLKKYQVVNLERIFVTQLQSEAIQYVKKNV